MPRVFYFGKLARFVVERLVVTQINHKTPSQRHLSAVEMPLGISPDSKVCGATSWAIPASADVWGFRVEAAELDRLTPQV